MSDQPANIRSKCKVLADDPRATVALLAHGGLEPRTVTALLVSPRRCRRAGVAAPAPSPCRRPRRAGVIAALARRDLRRPSCQQ
jgi:hypothetical protein